MLFSYKDCELKFGNPYQINKAVQNQVIYKVENGVYSDKPHVPELEVIAFKYPRGIFTLDSAFYYHGLTDVIPTKYFIATSKDAPKIKDSRVKQVFCRDERFLIGVSEMEHQGGMIRIYNRERMLIELIRAAKKLPFDYYKEIIESYRRTVYSLDIELLQEYVTLFPRGDSIMEAIELEVL